MVLPLVAHSSVNAQAVQLTFGRDGALQPTLSPDGRLAVYITGQPYTDVWSVATAGYAGKNLTQTPYADEDLPVFSPDGQSIAFASDRSGNWDIYLMDLDGGNARVAVGNHGADEIQPSFFPSGDRLAFAANATGNWEIYSASIGGGKAIQLTHDFATNRLPTVSEDGQTIAFRSDRDGTSAAYVMRADGSQVRRLTALDSPVSYPTLVADGSGIVFAAEKDGRTELRLLNAGGAGARLLQGSAGLLATPRAGPDSRQLAFAAAPAGGPTQVYLQPFESPLYRVATYGKTLLNGTQCDWTAGTWAFGLITVYGETGDRRYLNPARDWIDGCIAAKHDIGHVNDGLLGLAAISTYRAYGGAERLAFAEDVLRFFRQAPRATDGTLFHEPRTVWDDTLLGAVPFLLAMEGIDEGEQTNADFAREQVLLHGKHLREPVIGLFRHGWDSRSNTYVGPHLWARGNGWVLMAEAEVLRQTSKSDPSYSALLEQYRVHATALIYRQDSSSGLWHTIIDRPDFYEETSGSALIGYGLRLGEQNGWLLGDQVGYAISAAQRGVWKATGPEGRVSGVSGPTGPMASQEDYSGIPNVESQLYGQGAALLFFAPAR